MEEDILNYLYQLSCFVGHPVCKVVISFYLIVCQIITQKPLNRFTSNFDWGTL